MHGRGARTFAAHGARPGNPRRSRAAWSDRFDWIVLTVWRDRRNPEREAFHLPSWHGAGNEERRALLERVAVGDIVRVILCEAGRPTAEPRELKAQWADDRAFLLREKEAGGGFVAAPDMALPRLPLLRALAPARTRD